MIYFTLKRLKIKLSCSKNLLSWPMKTEKSFNQSPKTLRIFFYMFGVGGNAELTYYSLGGIEFLL